jgi:HK97 gp10 family phage protein
MVDGVKMEIKGLKELSDAMRKLPVNVARNGLRRAVSSGAKVIQIEARSRAPVDTGEMRRDIMIKRERSTKGEMSAEYSVFVRSGKKSRLAGKKRGVARDSFYWRFIEFGTKHMGKQPFMRPAFEAKKEVAANTIKKTLAEAIEKAATTLSRK